MVEMLGVLALMGVLAIGGIVGYRWSVNKYQSNEIWNNVKWVSLQVMTDGALQGLVIAEEVNLKTLSGDRLLSLKREAENSYSVTVSGLNEGVCRQIKRDQADWVEEVVSNDGIGCQQSDENQVKIYFNGGLKSENTDPDRYRRCESDAECGECGRCSEEKICIDYDNLCAAPTPYCVEGTCEPCPKGEILVGQTCYSCDDSMVHLSPSNAETCRQCKGSRLYSALGRCYRCDTSFSLEYISQEDCLSCPQRYFKNGYCHYCDGIVNADGTDCNWNCPAGQFGANSMCYDCDNNDKPHQGPSNAETCRQCKGSRFYSAVDGGRCYRCNTAFSVQYVSQEDCLFCPQRYWTSGACFLCPEKDSAEWQELTPTFQEQCSD